MNIENLFRNALENAEATPPTGAWEAIQAKMGASATVTTGAAATGMGIGKIAAIVITALGVGLGAGYLAFKGGEEITNENKQENTIANPGENKIEDTKTNDSNTSEPEVEITNISSVKKEDKMVSILEVKTGEKTKKIRVESSIANQWMTPEKEKAKRYEMMQSIMEEAKKEESKSLEQNKEASVQKDNQAAKVQMDYIEAGINAVADMENPMMYTFNNLTGASAYEWSFGDESTSKQPSPTHFYSSAGNYTVTLKIYDKTGKAYTTSTKVQVVAKESITDNKSSLLSNKPNIITPNNDGMNDRMSFEAINIEFFEFIVYNQKGQVVFTSTDPNTNWAGTDQAGNELPKGLYQYVYKAVGKDKAPYQGGSLIQINR